MSNPFDCTCKNAHKFCRVPHCKCPLHKISPQEMVEIDPFEPTFHPGKDFDVDEDLLDFLELVVLEDEFQSRIRTFAYYLTPLKQGAALEGAVCEYLVEANTYTKTKQEIANILRGIYGTLLSAEQLTE